MECSYAMAYGKGPSALLAQRLYQARLQTGMTEQARAALQHWLSGHPEDVGIRSLLATSLLNAGLLKQAIGEYLKVLEYHPDNVTALNNLAFAYQEEGDSEGLKYAERAYELVPERAGGDRYPGLVAGGVW